jgi:hypothetical protein
MFSFFKRWLFNDDITGTSSTMDGSLTTGSLFDTSGPAVNIDGTPMIGGIGGVDIHGHPYGVTDTPSGTTSIFDDTTGIHGSIGCGTDDMFSSSTISAFDEPFNNGCGGSMFDD